MALIKCDDCGASVSDQAQMCPKCSRPVTIEAEPLVSETESSGCGMYSIKQPFLSFIIQNRLYSLFLAYKP